MFRKLFSLGSMMLFAAGLSSCYYSGSSYAGAPDYYYNPGHYYGSGWGNLGGSYRSQYDRGFRHGREQRAAGRSFNYSRGKGGISGIAFDYYRRGYDAGWRSFRPNWRPYRPGYGGGAVVVNRPVHVVRPVHVHRPVYQPSYRPNNRPVYRPNNRPGIHRPTTLPSYGGRPVANPPRRPAAHHNRRGVTPTGIF